MATPTELVNRMASQKGIILVPKPEVLDPVKVLEEADLIIGEVQTPRAQSLNSQSYIEALQVKGMSELNLALSTADVIKMIYEDPNSDPGWREMSPFQRIQDKLQQVGGFATDVEAPEPVTLDILNLQDLLVKAKSNKGMPVFGPIKDAEHGIAGFAEIIVRDEVDGEISIDTDSVGGPGIVLRGQSLAAQLRGVSEIKILWTRDPMLLPKVEEKVEDHQKEGPAKAAVSEGITKPLNPFGNTIQSWDNQVSFDPDFDKK